MSEEQKLRIRDNINVTNRRSRLINYENQMTPTKSPISNRIYKDYSPPSAYSPLLKMTTSSQSTFANGSAIRHKSPQGCTIYYNEGIGLSPRPNESFRAAMSPQKLRLAKSAQILQYQNALLVKQLQERDDVILLYKKGWNPINMPINQGIVRQLNLQLSQKSVLIEQVHRSLAQFEKQVSQQKLQISPICLQRFKTLKELVVRHDHYPILISERIIDTSRSAQKVIIRQNSQHIEWQIRMEQSYKQLHTIKQRLAWFEKQNSILQSTIVGLRSDKADKDCNHIPQIQKLNNQVLLFQQEIANYNTQINTLNNIINELKQNDKATVDYQLKIQQLQLHIEEISSKIIYYMGVEGQLKELSAKVINYETQIDTLNKRQIELKRQLQLLKQQHHKQQWELRISQLNNEFDIKINDKDRQLQTTLMRIKELENYNKLYTQQIAKWKSHIQESQNYIQQLLAQIEKYKMQIQRIKQDKSQLESAKYVQQNERLSLEIVKLLAEIERIKKQCSSLKEQQNKMNDYIEKYKIQVREFQMRIQTLIKQRDSQAIKWQTTLNSKSNEYLSTIRRLELTIQQLNIKISGYDNKNGETNKLKEQIRILKLQIQQLKQQGRNYDSKHSSLVKQYQQQIRVLRIQIQQYKTKITNIKSQKTNEQWERQIRTIRLQYEQKLKDLWQKLNAAQDYIEKQTHQFNIQINTLQIRIKQLLDENSKIKQSPDEYLYKIDSRYEEIRKKLLSLSTKNAQSINAQSEFWEQYRNKRKRDLQEMQATINQSLSIVGNIQQVVVIRRSQLYRIDFSQLQDLLNEIKKMHQGKGQIASAMREQIQTKFYGLLQSYSTSIPQPIK